MDDDFDNVSWRNEPVGEPSTPAATPHSNMDVRDIQPRPKSKRRSSSTVQQAGHNADAVDLGGIGEGRLDCSVGKPLKESDGTKDAYVSYMVTTNVCSLLQRS